MTALTKTPAIDRALNAIDELEQEQHITPEMAKRSRDTVGLLFRADTVYATIGPIDGEDVSFYWVAGNRSISIDLYADGGCWVTSRIGDTVARHSSGHGHFPSWMWNTLADFSAHVQAVNPKWREMSR